MRPLLRPYILLLALMILSPNIKAQDTTDIDDPPDYLSRDTINGIYIPKDLDDCFLQIDIMWSDSLKKVAKSMDEEEFIGNTHFGIGMWMRNNWGLWGGSRLAKYFSDMGIFHPDDMSAIILTSYHRYLNGKEIKLEEQIKYYQDYWKKNR